ncbi:CAP domain-containing protein [Streptosporangium sp. NPDC000396]|uniref:CAP domain-containing protein n=1 Tax=Streptosporangium sp. NPDC000396 TaxID=3366185 RepID=UPI00368CC56F
MGLFACLVTVLLLGFLIGRESRTEETPNQIYLNNAGPAKPKPSAQSAGQVGRRTPLGRVIHPTATAKPSKPPRARTTRTPRNSAYGFDDDSRYVLNGNEGENTTANVSSPLSPMEKELVRLTNLERRKFGCAPLRVDRRLVKSAREHSTEMARSGTFSHNSPDGASPWDRMGAAGYRNGGAENIGRGYVSAAETVRNWMANKGHRGNILNCELTATGVGTMEGPGGPWWTQDFGYS